MTQTQQRQVQAPTGRIVLTREHLAVLILVVGVFFLAVPGAAILWGVGGGLLTAGIMVSVFGVLLGLSN